MEREKEKVKRGEQINEERGTEMGSEGDTEKERVSLFLRQREQTGDGERAVYVLLRILNQCLRPKES